MNVLISGGAKNGKSYYAQRIAQQMAEDSCAQATENGGRKMAADRGELRRPLYYIATMIPHDEEDHARIRRHIAERDGWGFETLEQGTDLMGLVRQDAEGNTLADPEGVFLLDSVTALLSNEMFREDGSFDPEAADRVAADCTAFARATGNTVFVSDYIYGDADRYDTMTEDYRRALAQVDRALARVCDRVTEVSAGIIEEWK